MRIIEEIIGENLRTLRRKAGLSQGELAEVSGVRIQSINRIEGGKQWANRSTLIDIANALGCTKEDFFKEPDPPTIIGQAKIIAELQSQIDALEPFKDIVAALPACSPKELTAIRQVVLKNYSSLTKNKTNKS